MEVPVVHCIHCKEPIAGVYFGEEDKGQLIVFAHRFCHEQVTNPKACPTCHHPLKLPTSMNIRPEGYVCEVCMLYYSAALQPIAKML